LANNARTSLIFKFLSAGAGFRRPDIFHFALLCNWRW